MANVRIITTGFAAVDRKLASLEPKVQKQVARKSTRNVAKAIREEARRKTPKETGLGRRSFKVRAAKRSRRTIGAQVIGGADQRGDSSPFYVKFLELGKENFAPLRMMRGPLYDHENRWRREFEKNLLSMIATL